MKKKLALLFLFLIIGSFFVAADIIMPGTKAINVGLKIQNMEDYPEYTFFLINDGLGGYEEPIILDSQVVYPQAYKFSLFYLCAGKSENFNSSKIDLGSLQDLFRGQEFNFKGENFVCFYEPIGHYSTVSEGSLVKSKINIVTIESSKEDLDFILETIDNFEEDETLPEIEFKTKKKYTFFPVLLALIVFLIELPIFYFILRKEKKKRPLWLLLLLVNLVTVILGNMIPIVTFILFLTVEIIIVFVEAIALKFLLGIKFTKTLLASFVANLVTAIIFVIPIIFLELKIL